MTEVQNSDRRYGTGILRCWYRSKTVSANPIHLEPNYVIRIQLQVEVAEAAGTETTDSRFEDAASICYICSPFVSHISLNVTTCVSVIEMESMNEGAGLGRATMTPTMKTRPSGHRQTETEDVSESLG